MEEIGLGQYICKEKKKSARYEQGERREVGANTDESNIPPPPTHTHTTTTTTTTTKTTTTTTTSTCAGTKSTKDLSGREGYCLGRDKMLSYDWRREPFKPFTLCVCSHCPVKELGCHALCVVSFRCLV